MSKLYYGVLSKSLEGLDIERYYTVMYFLSENNGCTQQYICNHLEADKTAMVKVMDSLVDSGYIIKKVNPQDRREQFIWMTKKGARQTEKIVKSFDTLDKNMFASIPKKDQQVFNRVLAQLSVNLKKLPANDLFFNYKKTARPLKVK